MLHSIKERLSIYKQAYERLNIEIQHDICTCICPNLWDLGNLGRVSRFTATTIKSEFPEFYAQKPPNAPEGAPWWEEDQPGNANRKEALLNAINICTKKIENEQSKDDNR